jgi:hypothetical protein
MRAWTNTEVARIARASTNLASRSRGRAWGRAAMMARLRAWASLGCRWGVLGVLGVLGWASVAVLAGCHPVGTATAAGGPASTSAAASCKVSEPVCDPTVSDAVALALVQRRCAGCHAEGGKAEHPLLEPSALFPERSDVAQRLSGCEMPPDSTPLPAEERRRLIGWGACAAAAAAAGEP